MEFNPYLIIEQRSDSYGHIGSILQNIQNIIPAGWLVAVTATLPEGELRLADSASFPIKRLSIRCIRK
jgi:hypothetical protein